MHANRAAQNRHCTVLIVIVRAQRDICENGTSEVLMPTFPTRQRFFGDLLDGRPSGGTVKTCPLLHGDIDDRSNSAQHAGIDPPAGHEGVAMHVIPSPLECLQLSRAIEVLAAWEPKS